MEELQNPLDQFKSLPPESRGSVIRNIDGNRIHRIGAENTAKSFGDDFWPEQSSTVEFEV
jgi:hypothetical protein